MFDHELRKQINRWYVQLLQDLILRNPHQDPHLLSETVQSIVLGLVFLHLSDERGLPNQSSLHGLLQEPYFADELNRQFAEAGHRYRAKLFQIPLLNSQNSETVDPKALLVDDGLLKAMIRRLCKTDAPFVTHGLTADALGKVYEIQLGQRPPIKNSRHSNTAVFSTKKTGGVYYTPSDVVQYMVDQSLNRVLKGKTPNDLESIQVLDPACGSGAFLVGVYQHLLNWHFSWYIENGAERWPESIRQIHGQWELTSFKRREILRSSIFGVDIDARAVEVTRLTLLLKAWETGPLKPGATFDRSDLSSILTDLEIGIRCGNSLLGSTSREELQLQQDLLPEVDFKGLFHWCLDFAPVFERGGFDLVIGNPPYRREKDFKLQLDEIACTPFGMKYRMPRMDLWYYFVHKGLQLLRPDGVLEFIANTYWLSGKGSEKLIAVMRDDVFLSHLTILGKMKVFPGVAGQHLVFQIVNQQCQGATSIRLAPHLLPANMTAGSFLADDRIGLTFEKTHEELFRAGKIDILPPARDILARIQSHPSLSEFGTVRQGIAENPASINARTFQRFQADWKIGEGVFALTGRELEGLNLSAEELSLVRPYFDLQDLSRFCRSASPSLHLIYSTPQTIPHLEKYPAIAAHLQRFRPIMEQRRETRRGVNQWWHLHWPRDEAIWRADKILSVQMALRPTCTPSYGSAYVPFSVNVFVPFPSCRESILYLCGILNSRVLEKWFQHHAKRRGAGLEINGHVLKNAPVRRIDFTNDFDLALYEGVVTTVTELMRLHQQLSLSPITPKSSETQLELETLEMRLDQFVGKLYGFTVEEMTHFEELLKAI